MKLMTKSARRLQIYICLLLCVPSTARSDDEPPQWVFGQIPIDAQYKYYRGHGSHPTSQSIAIEQANISAREKAAIENFSVTASIQSDSYQTANTSEIVKRSNVNIDDVSFHGIQEDKTFVTKIADQYEAHVLLKYEKKAITAEQHRLEAKAPRVHAAEHETGQRRAGHDCVAVIESTPSGVDVSIDNELRGRTPLRIVDLSPGIHELALDDEFHDSVREKFITASGKSAEINRTMKRSMGKVSITTQPEGAQVSINGRVIGKTTPVSDIEVPAGVLQSIELTHPDTFAASETVVVGKKGTQEIDRTLRLRPAYFSIRTEPAASRVRLEGPESYEFAAPVAKQQITPGHYRLLVSKAGYKTTTAELDIRAGSMYSRPIQLEPGADDSDSDTSPSWGTIERPSYVLGGGIDYSFKSVMSGYRQVGLHLYGEKRITDWLGIRGSALLRQVYSTANNQDSLTGYGIGAGLPVYFYHNTAGTLELLLMPQYDAISINGKSAKQPSALDAHPKKIQRASVWFGANINLWGQKERDAAKKSKSQLMVTPMIGIQQLRGGGNTHTGVAIGATVGFGF